VVESKQATFNLAGKVISFTMDCPHEYAVDRQLVHFDAGARKKNSAQPHRRAAGRAGGTRGHTWQARQVRRLT
jgi:hypothetical protein